MIIKRLADGSYVGLRNSGGEINFVKPTEPLVSKDELTAIFSGYGDPNNEKNKQVLDELINTGLKCKKEGNCNASKALFKCKRVGNKIVCDVFDADVDLGKVPLAVKQMDLSEEDPISLLLGLKLLGFELVMSNSNPNLAVIQSVDDMREDGVTITKPTGLFLQTLITHLNLNADKFKQNSKVQTTVIIQQPMAPKVVTGPTWYVAVGNTQPVNLYPIPLRGGSKNSNGNCCGNRGEVVQLLSGSKQSGGYYPTSANSYARQHHPLGTASSQIKMMIESSKRSLKSLGMELSKSDADILDNRIILMERLEKTLLDSEYNMEYFLKYEKTKQWTNSNSEYELC